MRDRELFGPWSDSDDKPKSSRQRALTVRVQEILDDSVVTIGPREAQWIVDAAADESAAVKMARRRSKGEPLQYLIGTAVFRHIDLEVGPGVFIPRPETELVAERAIELLPDGGTLVDIGTGSGAIALAVASERPDATVLATEADPSAFRWAVRNRDRLDLPVEMVRGDVFDGLPESLAGSIDVVVSNPPYVSTDRKHILPVDVRKHEPELALYGGGDGMAITSRIAEGARHWLKPGGALVLEMGEEQQVAVTDLMGSLGYRELVIGIDYARWPRIAVARWRP